jgi:PIN domain nuclease of toxin-antitoxin system
MNVLVDTHVYLWWLTSNRRLKRQARELLQDPTTLVHVSAASIWEIAIKLALGRLDVDTGVDFMAEIAANHFTPLSITPVHAWHAGSLPRYHDDPFDRMLIAQAQLEGLSIVTHDGAFESYQVNLVRT